MVTNLTIACAIEQATKNERECHEHKTEILSVSHALTCRLHDGDHHTRTSAPQINLQPAKTLPVLTVWCMLLLELKKSQEHLPVGATSSRRSASRFCFRRALPADSATVSLLFSELLELLRVLQILVLQLLVSMPQLLESGRATWNVSKTIQTTTELLKLKTTKKTIKITWSWTWCSQAHVVVLRRELEFLKDEVSPGPGDSAAVGSVLGLLLRQLADFDFHDHRPAVKMNQHPLWYLMSEQLSTLSQR